MTKGKEGNEMDGVFLYGLLLSLLAGAATTIGAAFVFLIRKPTERFLGVALGFSAGVMIAVSFFEMLPSSLRGLGLVMSSVFFFGGILFIYFLDVVTPHSYKYEKHGPMSRKKGHMMKLGTMVALGIAIHNFPEGFAVFAGSLSSARLGTVLAIAIALHNIPEGISVSMPIYSATGSRRKAFLYSFLSGIAEPIGAVIGFLVLYPFLSPGIVLLSLAFVAGIMVYISLDELIPAAHKYGDEHVISLSIIAGMMVMVLSLAML